MGTLWVRFPHCQTPPPLDKDKSTYQAEAMGKNRENGAKTRF